MRARTHTYLLLVLMLSLHIYLYYLFLISNPYFKLYNSKIPRETLFLYLAFILQIRIA
jgi:hypothetical protein